MIREQEMMRRMIDEMGDELNIYIKTCFDGCDFWKKKEGELLVNKTFKRILSIVADYNLTTVDVILENAYELIDNPNLMIRILGGFTDKYIKIGGDSLLNRTMAFCYLLFYTAELEEEVAATEILQQIIDSELIYKKESMWQKFKYTLGLAKHPYKINCKTRGLELVSLLRGNPIYETVKDIAIYKELI
jgi:hypothetical protein